VTGTFAKIPTIEDTCSLLDEALKAKTWDEAWAIIEAGDPWAAFYAQYYTAEYFGKDDQGAGGEGARGTCPKCNGKDKFCERCFYERANA
jgi:hypothetical protein